MSSILNFVGDNANNDEIRSWLSGMIVVLVVIWVTIQYSSGYTRRGGLGARQLITAGNVIAPMLTMVTLIYIGFTIGKYAHRSYKNMMGTSGYYGGAIRESEYFY